MLTHIGKRRSVDLSCKLSSSLLFPDKKQADALRSIEFVVSYYYCYYYYAFLNFRGAYAGQQQSCTRIAHWNHGKQKPDMKYGYVCSHD